MKLYLGVDPGMSGGITVVNEEGAFVREIRLDQTFSDIALALRFWCNPNRMIGPDPTPSDGEMVCDCWISFALVEAVHSMPKQGVSSSFKFGKSAGFLEGLLCAFQIRHELITPQKWQKAMGCMTHGDKNISKAAAQRLFPAVKVTHRNADALLLAELGRRISKERGW